MASDEIEHRYRSMGLSVKHFDDEPGHVYRYHHHERTYLYGLAGVGLMKLGAAENATYHLVSPGEELLVEDGVLHGGVAGPDGWRYVAASCDPRTTYGGRPVPTH